MNNSQSVKPQVTTKLEFITPKRAQEYLAFFDRNRRLRSSFVEFLVEEIKNGRWEVTTDSIGFDENGRGNNGQHRLNAISVSEKGVWVNVSRKMTLKSKNVIDQGIVRNPQDILTINGIDLGSRAGGLVKQLWYGGAPTTRKLSNPVLLEWARKAHDGIRFINEAIGKGKANVTVAPILAVLVRAYYARPNQREKIKTFTKVLVEGPAALVDRIETIKDPSSLKPALALQTFLLSIKTTMRVNASERYYKAEKMLQCYLDGNPMTKVTAATSELFPLPWDGEKVVEDMEAPPAEDGQSSFLIPVNTHGNVKAEDIVKKALLKHNIRLAATMCRKAVRPGDRVAFSYKAFGKHHVVGDAIVKDFGLRPRAEKDAYPYEMQLKDTRAYFESPIAISARLCGSLSMANDESLGNVSATQIAATLTNRMRPLTMKDFHLLTRKRVGQGGR